MFTPKTQRLGALAKLFPQVIEGLDALLGKTAIMYVDYGNVRNWADRLGWHVDLKRLKQLADSFSGPVTSKFYYGTLDGTAEEEQPAAKARLMGYDVETKPVKLIKLSIDASSVSDDSPDIIRHFISSPLLNTLSLETIKHLNNHLRDLNKKGMLHFEDKKCNFDVEIGRDMLVSAVTGDHTSVLWSCDSDFAGPVSDLLAAGRRVAVVGTSGMVARELNMLRKDGLQIFDVKKLKELICWARELPEEMKDL